MRIIAGRYRSRLIRQPKSRQVRPAQDRAKETLFNLLGPIFTFRSVLDLFAGSGSLGLEALSRGAERVVFVDHLPDALAVIRRNLESLGCLDQAELVQSDAQQAVGRLARAGHSFDLALLDPPYRYPETINCLKRLAHSAILRPGAWVVLKRDHHLNVPQPIEKLRLIKEIRCSTERFDFFCADL